MDGIYSLICTDTDPAMLIQNVEIVFCNMDLNKDGVVTENEFLQYCLNS